MVSGMDMLGCCSAAKARFQARLARLAVGAQTLARDLAAAPLCACALVGRMGWYTGWNLDALMASMNYLSANWERVAGMG